MKISPFESPPVTKAQGRGAEGPQQPRPRAEALRVPSPEGQGPRPRGPAIHIEALKWAPQKGPPKGGLKVTLFWPPPRAPPAGVSARIGD